jgi:hypothetical protein
MAVLEQLNRLLAIGKQESEDDIFLRTGRALNVWNRVEELTCMLFHKLLLGRAYELSFSCFYELTAFSTRLTLMGEAANWCLRYSGFEREFASLRTALERMSGRRNAIAHSTCYTQFFDGDFQGYLSRHATDFKSIYRELTQSRSFSLTAADIHKFTMDCVEMRIWLVDFMTRWHPWHTWLSISPKQHLDRVARYNRRPSESSQTPQIAGLLPPP